MSTEHCKYLGFPGGTSGKEPVCQCRQYKRCGFDSWIEKIPWRRKWQPTPVFLPGKFHEQRSLAGYSPRSWKESDTTEWLSLSLLEKEMATLSSNLAWRIPWTEEPGRLQSIGLKRVRHDWATITHVWIWELNHKESWARKNWCF